MSIAGIICEYNPFHNGHRYHISETRRTVVDCDGIVCVMSGNFVQRGDCAIMEKHVRARAAVLNGADLVIELPTPWVLSSAEGFAKGGIWLLERLGIVTHLSFGSECGDIDTLNAAAETMIDSEWTIRDIMSTGISYAAAREKALAGIDPALGEILRRPNNILAVEYLRAIRTMRSPIQPVTVSRHMADHDSGTACDNIASASYIRTDIEKNMDYIPENIRDLYYNEIKLNRSPAALYNCERAILGCLRSMEQEQFDQLAHGGEGLGQKLYKAVQSENSLDGIMNAVKSKRYPMSRVRRMILCAWLSIGKNAAAGPPPYIRVLAANERGREMLREAKKKTYLPIITKPAAARDLDEASSKLFRTEARITAQYGLTQPNIGGAGDEWRFSPVMV